MNDLRRDVNEVFAKQQGQLGEVAGTGNRMLRAATAGRRVNRQLWPSVAGVALVLVAASAIGVSVVIRGLHTKNVVTTHPSPTPIATPTATPAPTPMSQLLHVPSSTPVILFRDPVNSEQLDGVTWDGSARGRVGTNPDIAMGFVQNPAGTLYGWTGYIRDRAGTLVASPTVNTKGFSGTWADDGQRYCNMVSKSALPPAGGEPATLQVTAVGQAPRNVVRVAKMYDQASAGVAACSMEKDRAVVIQGTGTAPSTVQFWVVQLSTGRILWTRSNTGDTVASRDAQFIAEISYSQPGGGSASTTIYNSSGTVLDHLPGRVEAFSWDGSLAVQVADSGAVSVVRWRDGTVLWTGPPGAGYYDAMPEPGGQRIAVFLLDPSHPQTGGWPPRNVYAVGPDGKAIQLLTDIQ
ncbi:MAG TPA: hypothetical protein VHK65_13800 [Candidatus Dormibacteraeota bacterium]|nr:hypothetical protein [Candidatus Dormibacteraeota bacterium]